MKIGITGHQERDGIDWVWVRSHLERILAVNIKLVGYSSLAVGTDQVFAEAVLNTGGQLTAVIPIKNYISYFDHEALEAYVRLLASAEVVELRSTKPDKQAFFDAGKWIVRKVDRIIAVWDGGQAEGTGGTGDIVAYALAARKPVIHLNPISREVVER